jgi:hypothetical protein
VPHPIFDLPITIGCPSFAILRRVGAEIEKPLRSLVPASKSHLLRELSQSRPCTIALEVDVSRTSEIDEP